MLILLLLSAVRKDMLLISFITTKFCSSLLKFWNGNRKTEQLEKEANVLDDCRVIQFSEYEKGNGRMRKDERIRKAEMGVL